VKGKILSAKYTFSITDNSFYDLANA